MAKSIKGTETEKNLLRAFAGESQAHMRYKFFASAAKKEGYEQISAIFTETSNQEKEHAERFFKFLEGNMVNVDGTWPAGVIGTTAENLAAAAAGEHEEWGELYPSWADVAEKEGFGEIAAVLRNIATVEKFHEGRYKKMLAHVEAGDVFSKPESIVWQCRNCGFIIEGKDAPKLCPACAHPQAYFEPKVELL
jgi:rubrerythrin